MNRNSKHVRKPDEQNDARPAFDKDQPSGPAGGPNPDRYKKALRPRLANDESGLPKRRRSQEGERRDTPDTERPPDENVTDAADDRQAPPFTGEDVERPHKSPVELPRRSPDDSQSPSHGRRRVH